MSSERSGPHVLPEQSESAVPVFRSRWALRGLPGVAARPRARRCSASRRRRGIAQLLHVEADQRAGIVLFANYGSARRWPGRHGKPVDPAARQHAVHRRGDEPDPGGDDYLPEPLFQRRFTIFTPPAGGAPRTAVRPRTAIDQAGQFLVPIATGPALRGRLGDNDPAAAQETDQPCSIPARGSRCWWRGQGLDL
jgi:hypothetical protein